jgi:hypothetical protein
MYRLSLLLSVPLLLTGCAAIPLATLGTVAGLTATAVSTGADVYSRGKLDSAELVSLREVRDAVQMGVEEMGLTFELEQSQPGEVASRYRDDLGALMKITLEARTPTLTRIRIDVGASGSEPTARLMLKRIRAHLPPAAAVEPADRDAAPPQTHS